MERDAGKTWKDLKSSKSSENSGVTWRVRLRFAAKLIKRIFYLAIISGLAFGAWQMYESGEIDRLLTPSTEELKVIQYKTDGHISKSWATENRLFPPVQNLADIDILSLKEKFERVSQVKSANIQKIYPDKIRIEIQEYRPCARVAISQNKRICEYALAKEGVIFDPVCISRDELMELPWVIGIPIVKNERLFEPYEYAGKIDELVKKAKAALPEHFKTWRTLNAKELDSITLPILVVTNSDKTKIIFHANNIDFQLKKLEYILRFYEQDGLSGIEKIDLSFESRAIVTMRKESNER